MDRAAIQVRDGRRKDRERARRIVIVYEQQRFLALWAVVDDGHRAIRRARHAAARLFAQRWHGGSLADGAYEVSLGHFVTVDQVFTDGLSDAAWLDRHAAQCTFVPHGAHVAPLEELDELHGVTGGDGWRPAALQYPGVKMPVGVKVRPAGIWCRSPHAFHARPKGAAPRETIISPMCRRNVVSSLHDDSVLTRACHTRITNAIRRRT